MDRTLIDCEPGVLAFGGATFYSDNITMKIDDSVNPTPAGIVSNAGDTWDDAMVKISANLVGEIESLAVLYPYAAFRMYQNIFGNDAAATIKTSSGRLFTVPSAAVTKSPDLNLGPDKTFFASPLEITGVRKKNATWGTAGSLYTEGVGAWADADYAAFNAAGIVKQAYTAAWGALTTPWNAISTEEGWQLSFGLALKAIKDAAVGTVQMIYQGETVVAKCRSLNVTATDIMAAHPVQGAGRRGARIASASDLVLTGESASPVITLTAAQLRGPGYQFGSGAIRNGELGFEAQRTFTTGKPNPLYTFA